MTACEKAMAGKGKTAPADAPQTIGEKVAAYRKKLEAAALPGELSYY